VLHRDLAYPKGKHGAIEWGGCLTRQPCFGARDKESLQRGSIQSLNLITFLGGVQEGAATPLGPRVHDLKGYYRADRDSARGLKRLTLQNGTPASATDLAGVSVFGRGLDRPAPPW